MPRGLVVKNDSKMRGRISAAIPGPLSAISTTTSGPSSKLRTRHHVALGVGLVERLRGVQDQVQEHLAEARPRWPAPAARRGARARRAPGT